MSHSYMHNPVHLVYSTKQRAKLIPKDSQPRLAGVCKKQRIFVHEIGGMEGHVHMLIEIPLVLAFSDAIQEIKTSSSRWMGHSFAWQRGFGVFGVSASNKDAVIRYIQTQEAHHKKMTFEEEFVALLKKHAVDYDPRYVFG
jgi:REP element-mobilizing transposase RayT